MPFFNREVNAPVHAIKAHVKDEVQMYSFLTLALDRHGQLHAPDTLCPSIPWYPLSRRLGGLQSGLHILEKDINLMLLSGTEP